MVNALAYHITFTTYGTRLHGDERGTVDDRRNIPGTPVIKADPGLVKHRENLLKHEPRLITPKMRGAIDKAIREVCKYRGWQLHALNIRTNHVHAVVSFRNTSADRVMGDFKSYATRALRERRIVEPDVKVWTAKGSTRPIFDEDGLWRVVQYVEDEQGPPLPME